MPPDRWVGQVIGGRYQIEELLGQGGMSAVYRARDLNLRRTVAIKLIHPHLSDNEEFVRRFESEATAIARLRHPNIVEAYDLSHDGDQYYMVLEFVEGETLQNRIKRANSAGRHLPVRDTVSYLIDICKAAGYAHQRGMIHRDIKPANIMLTANGSAVLMDFGIARILGEGKHTATGAVLGTALYMSPEQIQGLHPDARSDIYSLGVTLFEALGGRPPFEADSAMTLMRMHLYDPVPDLSQLNPSIPEAVRAIANRALEKDPANRFQTCTEMAAALEEALRSLPDEETVSPGDRLPPAPVETDMTDTFVEPPIPERPQPSGKTTEPAVTLVSPAPAAPGPSRLRRKWLAWAGAGALLAVIAAGAFLLFRQLNPPAAMPTATVAQTESATATHALAVLPTATTRVVLPSATADLRPKLVIAVLAPLSNPIGISIIEGMQTAVDEWNNRNGVLNMRVTPLIFDSKCDPDASLAAAHQAIEQEGVHYILGDVCTAASIPVSDVANASKVVMISPSSTNPAVTLGENDAVKPFVFRACFSDPFQGVIAAQFAIQNLKVKSAFILSNPDNPFDASLAETFKLSFTHLGGVIAGEGSYTTEDGDFSAVLEKIKAAKPGLVYLPGDVPIVNRMLQQARAMGITLPFLGSDRWDSEELDRTAAAGSFFTNDFSAADPRPEVQRFVEAYGARYKNEEGRPRIPGDMAALGYDAANLLLQSIQETGVDDPVRVKDTLAGIHFNGVTGVLAFDAKHNPIKSAVVLAVRDGKIVFETVVNP